MSSLLGGIGKAGGVATNWLGMAMGAAEQGRVANIMRNLPGYDPVDITKSQAATIAGNQANLPGATKLAQATSLAELNTTQQMLRQMLGDYDQMTSRASKLVAAQLGGELFPEDVQQTLRSTAARAVGGGFGGSGMHRNLTGRDLGLSQYQQTQQGLTNYQNLLQTTRATMPQPLSVRSMFLTPEDRLGVDLKQQQSSYESLMTQALGKTTPGETGYWAQALQSGGGGL